MSAAMGKRNLKKRRQLQLEDMRNVSTLERTFETRKQTLMKKAMELEQACGVEVLVTVKMEAGVTYYYCSNLTTINHLKSCGVIGKISQNAAEVLMVLPSSQMESNHHQKGDKQNRELFTKKGVLKLSNNDSRNVTDGRKPSTTRHIKQSSNTSEKSHQTNKICKKISKSVPKTTQKTSQNLILLKSSSCAAKAKHRASQIHANFPSRDNPMVKSSPDISLFAPIAPPKPRTVPRFRKPSVASDSESTSEDDSDDSSDESDATLSETKHGKPPYRTPTPNNRRQQSRSHAACRSDRFIPQSTMKRVRSNSLSVPVVKSEQPFNTSLPGSIEPFPTSNVSVPTLPERIVKLEKMSSFESPEPYPEHVAKGTSLSSQKLGEIQSSSSFPVPTNFLSMSAGVPKSCCNSVSANPSCTTQSEEPVHLLTTLCSKPHNRLHHYSAPNLSKNVTQNNAMNVQSFDIAHPLEAPDDYGDVASDALSTEASNRDYGGKRSRDPSQGQDFKRVKRSPRNHGLNGLFVIDKTRSVVKTENVFQNRTDSTDRNNQSRVKGEKSDEPPSSGWPLSEIEELHSLRNSR